MINHRVLSYALLLNEMAEYLEGNEMREVKRIEFYNALADRLSPKAKTMVNNIADRWGGENK
ncbi:MAG: hypothetical protein ACTSQY_11115 [Candidatus Odinarchaeia archaeon]